MDSAPRLATAVTAIVTLTAEAAALLATSGRRIGTARPGAERMIAGLVLLFVEIADAAAELRRAWRRWRGPGEDRGDPIRSPMDPI